MKSLSTLALALSLLCLGCTQDTEPLPESDSTSESSSTGATAEPMEGVAGDIESTEAGSMALSPENTKIEFVGTHVGDDPRPRTGGFRQFSGTAEFDAETLSSLAVEIQMDSVWTDAGPNLVAHLKTEDFFDVRQYPTATFQSTSIEPGDDGKQMIRGDFTMHGTTRGIAFPAEVSVANGDVRLQGEFTIDRTEWGMDRLADRVEEEVTMRVAIGETSEPPTADGGGGGGGGRGFDPVARFREMDANDDGKLTGDEISERLQGRMETLDSDGDGELTLEEFQEGLRNMFRGRGGRGGEQTPPAADVDGTAT